MMNNAGSQRGRPLPRFIPLPKHIALQSASTHPVAAAETRPTSSPRRLFRRLDRIFVVTVLIPTTLSILYFGLMASDIYTSESRFLVRSPERTTPSASGLSALLAGTGFSRATDDTYSVHDYVLSRDASTELDRRMNLRALFSSDKVDVLNRFANFSWENNLESFNVYYQKRVDIEYDPSTSVTTLTVKAFSAKDAHDINEQLIGISENLLNTMNERSRHDLVDEAENEVRVAESQDLDATARLTDSRANESIIDATGEAGIAMQRIGHMRDDLLASETQLDQLRHVSPSNPQIASLAAHVDLQRRAIASESAALTSKAAGSLNSKAGALGRLMLEKEFADKILQGALVNLDDARTEVTRKHLYLERIVQPNLPDHAMEPRRVRSIITVLALGLVAWGIVSLVVSSVREHTD